MSTVFETFEYIKTNDELKEEVTTPALSYLNIVVTEGEDEHHDRRDDQPERRLKRNLLQEVQRAWYLNTHVVLNLFVLIGNKQNLFRTIKE